jgi:CubicO group peptidase (beta-lactamase class C family)
MLLRRVFAALLAIFLSGAARAADPADELQGLWVSHTPFERPSGELVVSESKGEWTAALGGRAAPVEVKKNGLSLRFPEGQGAFRGRRVGDRRIEGFWIQEGVSDQPFAAPLTLRRATNGEWRGDVPQLDLGFTLYLKIFRREDGVLIGAFRNPEINTRGGASRFFLQRQGPSVRFLERDDGKDGIVHTAALLQGPDRLKLMWPQFRRELELVRKAPEEAAAFFPKPPGTAYIYEAPPVLGDGWQTAAARKAGIDEAALTALVKSIVESDPAGRQPSLIHSLLIARNGTLVLEEYFFGHDRDTLHDLRSAGKTFASVMLGAVMQEGAKLSPDTPVAPLLKDRGPFANPAPSKDRITLAHLMTHTSGLACNDNDENSPGGEERLQTQQAEADYWKYTLDLPMLHEPGSRYAYCSAGMNLMGGALATATKTWLPDLFDRTIARPLRFGLYAWNLAPNEEGYLGGGARLRPRDLLKVGQLYLDGGIWRGRRIVARDWVKASTTPRVPVNETTTGLASEQFGNFYAPGAADALAWHTFDIKVGDRTYKEYEAAGNGGQLLIVVPELDLAVVMTGGNYGQGGIWGRWRDQVVGGAIIPAIVD